MGEDLTLIEFLTIISKTDDDYVYSIVGRFQNGSLNIDGINTTDLEDLE